MRTWPEWAAIKRLPPHASSFVFRSAAGVSAVTVSDDEAGETPPNQRPPREIFPSGQLHTGQETGTPQDKRRIAIASALTPSNADPADWAETDDEEDGPLAWAVRFGNSGVVMA
jgi:hypothetical protein